MGFFVYGRVAFLFIWILEWFFYFFFSFVCWEVDIGVCDIDMKGEN